MQDNYFFKTDDLILKVNTNYDHNYLKIEDWEDYIDCLCGNRYYQSQAIKNCIIYFASGKYHSIEDIVSENYTKNGVLKEKYPSLDNYLENLQIKNKLTANIDLATGTGKSYVIFGVAQIMLGLG